MKITWFMVPEIWSMTDMNFFIVGPFLHFNRPPPPNNSENQNFEKMKKTPGDITILHKSIINDHHMMYGSCDHIFVILNYFFFFYPTNNSNNQNFEKIKKPSGDHLTQVYQKKHVHMLYFSWDIASDRCKCYFSFWFSKNSKLFLKMREHLEISFSTCVAKIMIRQCMVPEI